MTANAQQHPAYTRKPYRDRLWWLAISPSLWAVHFLVCYLTVAIWCEKTSAETDANILRWLACIYTCVAMVAITIVGWLSFKNTGQSDQPPPDEFDDLTDRSPFLGFTSFLLALLSGIATLFTALVFVFVKNCD